MKRVLPLISESVAYLNYIIMLQKIISIKCPKKQMVQNSTYEVVIIKLNGCFYYILLDVSRQSSTIH